MTTPSNSVAKAWLWPDRHIGKRESRKLREEHNALYNEHARLIAALEEIDSEGYLPQIMQLLRVPCRPR